LFDDVIGDIILVNHCLQKMTPSAELVASTYELLGETKYNSAEHRSILRRPKLLLVTAKMMQALNDAS